MALLLAISKQSPIQWSYWAAFKALSTHVVSAEAAQHVAQHGRHLVRMPEDMVQTLDGYFKDAGLTGKRAKLRTLALTDQLKALSRTQAKGGLQPYRSPAAAAPQPAGMMTQEQLQEQQAMEAELEQMAAAFGPEALQRHRQVRAAAQAAAALPLPTTRSGRVKAKAKAALQAHIQAHGMLSVPHEHLRAALDLPPSNTLTHTDKVQEIKKVTPAYHEPQALAYALARLPGCYAASMRIFKELAVRLPGVQPRTLLDFGSGPGTASWAAQEAWPQSLSRLTAVEPSAAMRRLGERLEAARRFAHQQGPMMRWVPSLPPVPRGQRKPHSSQGMHDIVVASYVLGEVADPQERAALVRHLWGLTSDVLVLVEPGTPAGAANIQDARAAILQHEARRAAKLHRRQAALGSLLSGNSSSSIDTSAEPHQQQQQDHNLSTKLGSKWHNGAHVVAPCPHDGPCPLTAPGSKAWCHFGTRFQRPSFMQAAKALPGTHVNPMDHQDERYSYVVIRRGARPVVTTQLDISRTFKLRSSPADAPYAVQHAALSESDTDSCRRSDAEDNSQLVGVQPQQQQGDVSTHMNVLDLGSHGTSGSASALARGSPHQKSSSSNGRKLFGDLYQHGMSSDSGQQRSSGEAQAAPQTPKAGSILTTSELQQLSSLLGLGSAEATAAMAAAGRVKASSCVQHTAAASEHYKHVNTKLNAFGEGLVNRLMALEDAGVSWEAGGMQGLLPELATQALIQMDQQHDTTSNISEDGTRNTQSIPGDVVTTLIQSSGISGTDDDGSTTQDDDDDDDEHSGEDMAEVHQGQQARLLPYLLAELDQVAAASSNWSRIIRPPRKRGRHVILDLCTACSDVPSAARPSQPHNAWPVAGQLERHIVARSDTKKWMGKAAYTMAQDAHWGDLWPTAYNRNRKKQALET